MNAREALERLRRVQGPKVQCEYCGQPAIAGSGKYHCLRCSRCDRLQIHCRCPEGEHDTPHTTPDGWEKGRGQ